MKTTKDCIAAIKKLPGIKCEPKLHEQSDYVDTVKHAHTGTVKAIVFRKMFYVAVESYWKFDLKGRGSWIKLETGLHPTPQKAVMEWNDLVDTIRKGDK